MELGRAACSLPANEHDVSPLDEAAGSFVFGNRNQAGAVRHFTRSARLFARLVSNASSSRWAGAFDLVRIRNIHSSTPVRSWLGSPSGLRVTSSGMDFNRRAQERQRAAVSAAEEVRRAEVERKAEARKIVEIWSAHQVGGRALWFYPTIGAAIAAGFPSLTFSCAAYRSAGFTESRLPTGTLAYSKADQMRS